MSNFQNNTSNKKRQSLLLSPRCLFSDNSPYTPRRRIPFCCLFSNNNFESDSIEPKDNEPKNNDKSSESDNIEPKDNILKDNIFDKSSESDNIEPKDNDKGSESDNTPGISFFDFDDNPPIHYDPYPSPPTDESVRDFFSKTSRGLWTICENCNGIIFVKHLKENNQVCYSCSYHHRMSSQERIDHLLDVGSWRPLYEDLSPLDPLEFFDQKNYTERLEEAQERTGLQDAIQTGTGKLDTIPIAFGAMDFDFMGGSMGSVVGEKITRLIEYATKKGLTLLLVCSSGGARMQEGILSLMQMAKISAALQVYQSSAKLLYISLLTTPTTGGVTASFAMLGDVIVAEPKALIGFAGRRVIEQTLQEELPIDFQTAEYLLHHGLLDLIVPRRFLRQAFSEVINFFNEAPLKQTGTIPQQFLQKKRDKRYEEEKGVEEFKGIEGVKEIEKTEKRKEIEKAERAEGVEKAKGAEGIEKPEEAEGAEEVEKSKGAEGIKGIERVEEIEKAEKVKEIEKAERVEEKAKGIEEIEKAERVEEKAKGVEEIEKAEGIEKIEKAK